MYLNKGFASLMVILFVTSCAAPTKRKPILIAEQIVLDTQKAKDLIVEFEKKAERVVLPASSEQFLNQVGRSIAEQEYGFDASTVQVRIHRDHKEEMKRVFAFPGTIIYLPVKFIQEVQYENELAAGIAFALAQVIERFLAKRLEPQTTELTKAPIVFGSGSVFDLDRKDRQSAIGIATRLLIQARYDARGLPSYFQRYFVLTGGGLNVDSESFKKELEFNIRESNGAKSQHIPIRDPIVRSEEFIMMKKKLKVR